MQYSNIITNFLNLGSTPGFLIKLNIWALINLKFFFFKTNSVIFFFISNLNKFKIKFLKFNNYYVFYFYFMLLIIITLCFIILL